MGNPHQKQTLEAPGLHLQIKQCSLSEVRLSRKILHAHTPGVPSDIPPLPPDRDPIILPPESPPVAPDVLPPREPPVPQKDPPTAPPPLDLD